MHEDFFRGLQDNISPEAVALVAYALQNCPLKPKAHDQEIGWLTDELINLVGGPKAYQNLLQEIRAGE